jgi:hypothetical protein
VCVCVCVGGRWGGIREVGGWVGGWGGEGVGFGDGGDRG